MKYLLRDYQQLAVNNVLDAYRNGRRAPLLVCPTGSGKTVIFCYIGEKASLKAKRVLILEHRQELVAQATEKLSEMGVAHGVIAPGRSQTIDLVQVASVYTAVRRLDRLQEPDIIIVDECHHSGAETWAKILNKWPKSKVLGVTATPCRMDGKGLGISSGGFYDSLVCGPSMRWLIDHGHLSDYIVYGPPTPLDLSDIKTVAGDFDKKEVNHRVDKAVITGCSIEHYSRLCPGVPAIAFCASVKHAEHVAEQFNSAGIPAASIDGNMSDEIRKSRIRGLANGQIKLLSSCDIISEGTDIPVVTTAILLRPTKSTGLFLQQVGRVLRPFEGKSHAVILDHVGNCHRHGLPDDDRGWSLDGAKIKRRKKSDVDEVKTRMCKQCFAIFGVSKTVCPQCGTPVEIKERSLKQVDGELKQINEVQRKKHRFSREDWDALNKIRDNCRARKLSPADAYRIFHRLKSKGFLEAA